MRAAVRCWSVPVLSLARSVSRDGKTLTVKQPGTDPQGKPVRNVLVFEKQ